jgi:NAD+ diphosphatase
VYDVRWRATHRFCGECGGALADCPGFSTRQCPACGTLPYVGRLLAPVVIVAVHRGDELLLVRHHAELWALVAGYVDPGETLEQAVAREVAEEVGLEVTDIRYAGSKGWSLDDPGVLMAAFTARCAADAEPVADGVELSAARFYTRAELPANRPAPHSFAAPLIAAFESSRSPR